MCYAAELTIVRLVMAWYNFIRLLVLHFIICMQNLCEDCEFSFLLLYFFPKLQNKYGKRIFSTFPQEESQVFFSK